MQNNYLKLLGLHVIIGVLVYLFRPLGQVYFYGVISYFILKIISTKPQLKGFQIVSACAYIVGAEVVFRVTNSGPFYEASKYLIILFCVIGLFYQGFSKKATSYLLYLLLLIPSIYVSLYVLDIGQNIRKAIAFNLSGPVCLGVAALFCYNLKLTKTQLGSMLNYAVYPLVSTLVYVIAYNPNVAAVSNSTGSNFAASGGFGPNQMSTVLGLGFFIMTIRFFYFSKTKLIRYLDLLFILLFAFRAIVTFSRGGVLTAIIMILAFVVILYNHTSKTQKRNLLFSLIGFLVIGLVTWLISASQTNGLIEKRYANQNAMGIEKSDVTTGRGELFLAEFDEFLEHPFLGVGVGRVKDLRFQKTGIHAASHNEMSRIIAEHGLLGMIAFTILLLVPLFFRLQNRSNVLFFSFYLFWLLTINHSAMRIAAPAFIYALSLLYIIDDTPSLHRKQINKAQ
ncbi:O-antigen ligase domain-containing protein [Olleya aquimaris]|uniref:O-antigen ligase family protein n=1 Tax=Olleya sediminilitoris TaxID=2795739 RepID=A0ABS1WKR2_9FLAO|nr:O-antigen ligase family protein [Olleya sediminilitoris]AXO81613.1 O-antigen ligase domain-containing protein [Olleya aquimaris]MBL7559714.1 O-antigen ligase family protein [Olleya sediminilitoris]